jgi:hypothetical protein
MGVEAGGGEQKKKKKVQKRWLVDPGRSTDMRFFMAEGETPGSDLI